MSPTNFPSARSPVLRTRGVVVCSVTVRVGDCAVSPAGRASERTITWRRSTRATLEAMIEPKQEAQSFACRHRLGDVNPETTPVRAQSGVHQPARESRDATRGYVSRPLSHEPPLSRVREDDEGAIARARAEWMAGHGIRTADGQTALQRERIAPQPAATDEPQIHATRGADARIAAHVEEEPAEAVRPVGRNRIAYRRGDPRVRHDVVAARMFERRTHQPPRGGSLGIVARVERRVGDDGVVVALVDRRVGAPRLVVAENRPGIFDGHARLPLVAEFE